MYTRIYAFDQAKTAALEGEATAANQQTQITAEQAILAKLIAAPSTEAKQDTIISALTALAGYEDGVEALLTSIDGKDFATQTTLAAVLAKIIAAPATEAKQDTGNTSLASILAALPTALTALGNLKVALYESKAGHKSSVTLTRPATTPTYVAGQVVGGATTAILEFTGLGPANANVLLTNLLFELYLSTSSIGRMTAYFYSTQPSAITDTTAWDYAGSDQGKLETYFQISQPEDKGSAHLSKNYIGESVQLGNAGQLYCVITTDVSYVGAASAVMKISLHSLEQ